MDDLLKYAYSFLGQRYRWGGDDTIDGFDCSGLVQEILSSVGMDPPGDQTAHGLYKHFLKTGERRILMRGSLCFFGRPSRITHVGFAVDNWRQIEAGGGGSATRTAKDAANQNAFVRVRPVLARSDLVEAILPNYNHQELFG